MAGERLRVVRVGSLAAVVGTLPRKPSTARHALIAYDAAVRRIAALTTGIVPARFNTVVADDEEIAMILHARQATLKRALAHVRNRVQMTVRVPMKPVERALSDSLRGPGKIRATPVTGAEFLRARAMAAAEERQVPGFDPIRAAVAKWVRDERVEKRAGVASVYHLVPVASAATYRRALERAAAPLAMRLIVSGPFPPYAFAAPL
jgi:hypothetical protein